MRTTFINTLTEMARKDPRIMCIIGDTGFSVFEDFEAEFGNRFINVGIAEQNFVGFGAGLAAMGMKPYLYNVVSFMTLRATEEIMLDICYQENPVVLVGVGGGHAYATAGPTHHALQDIATMTMMPNMTVVCPGDPIEMKELMLASLGYNKPLYIRIGRSVDPIVHNMPIEFKIGKALLMREGTDGVLFATGTMLKDAVAACDLLESRGVNMTLYSMHTIKPLDEETILECARKYPAIFTVEEHSLIGGLGAAVGNLLAQNMEWCNTKFKPFGIPDQFAPVTGTREYLNDLYGMSAEKMANTIYNDLEQSRE